jgi:hypothetical protein
MVNDREEGYEGHEEGEYHFSDDQSGYEVEPEGDTETETEAPVAKAPAATGSASSALMMKVNQYRRAIIGVVVFVVLIFIVYKMLIPSTPATSTDFTDTTAAKAPPKTMAAQVPAAAPQQQAAAPAPAPVATPAPVQPQLPAQNAIPVEQPNPMLAPQQPPAMPQQQTVQQPPAPVQQPATQLGTTPTSAPPVAQPTTMTPPAVVVSSPPTTNPTDQSTTTTIVESEYGQKMADYEAQNAALQGRVKELNRRMANMEATLNQISRLLINKQMPTSMSSAYAPARPSEPRVAYTVQAIIPGRAWLKSDAGDTVTVAEGDVLKDYGRITKIDPYDGVVEIDTGSKTITLSYGAGGD